MESEFENTQPSKQATEKTEKKIHKRRAASGLEHQSASPSLELYQIENSADCRAIRVRLSELGLDYICRNVPEEDPLKHERLVQAGGKNEIPFFMDHLSGTKLYGAAEILLYLEAQYGKLPESPILRVAHRINTHVQQNARHLVSAVSKPVSRIQSIRSDAREAWQTIGSSWEALRRAIREQDEDSLNASAGHDLSEKTFEEDLKHARG